MSHSTHDNPLPTELRGVAAIPYLSLARAVPGGARIYAAASGGLWRTPSDLARYGLEVQRSLVGKSNVLSAATARQSPGDAALGLPDLLLDEQGLIGGTQPGDQAQGLAALEP
jgi:CubicO group peptidase (beta-lactamase class C family)